MIIVVHSKINAAKAENNFGEAEYSYHFVLKEFLPVLQQLGTVATVSDPWREVDAIFHEAVKRGEDCVFLSFSPPHQTPLDLACPTIPCFAWEFDTIPAETWYGEREQDWRFVLNKLGRAITHSSFAVRTVQSAMGKDFPIASIPSPVWDRFGAMRPQPRENPVIRTVHLNIAGRVLDTRTSDLSAYSSRRRPVSLDAAQVDGGRPAEAKLAIDGVVYTTVFNPYDNRKNHLDMICAFCLAFRDVPDATLIIKLSHHDSREAIDVLMADLYKLTPFECRVVLIDGFLSDTDYMKLLAATTFALNTSHGEGQCLPLMEYMSYGMPAVAPCHTGMLDYLSAENAFLVHSTAEPAWWQHDPRAAIRTLRRRIDFESLVKAYRDSYQVAKEAPDRYAAMAAQARLALKQHCSSGTVLQRLREVLTTPPRRPRRNRDYGKIVPRPIDCSLGRSIDFAANVDTRRYLTAGWNTTELGRGVWSEGSTAELAFHLRPRPKSQLLLRIHLSAFLTGDHTNMEVQVAANGVALARWRFNLVHPEEIDRSWREVLIPAEIASTGELHITLQIEHPIAPRQLGLSNDRRRLGIMLHELSLSAVDGNVQASLYIGKLLPRSIAYSLDQKADFVTDLDSRRYLVAGWSNTEVGQGVWSDGPIAEMAFEIEPKHTGPLVLRFNLSAFLAEQHADLGVNVEANGVALTNWTFELSHPEEIEHSWREATIPAEIASQGGIHISLQIEHPISPWELGLSDDRRQLGIRLHELSISAVNTPPKRKKGFLSWPHQISRRTGLAKAVSTVCRSTLI